MRLRPLLLLWIIFSITESYSEYFFKINSAYSLIGRGDIKGVSVGTGFFNSLNKDERIRIFVGGTLNSTTASAEVNTLLMYGIDDRKYYVYGQMVSFEARPYCQLNIFLMRHMFVFGAIGPTLRYISHIWGDYFTYFDINSREVIDFFVFYYLDKGMDWGGVITTGLGFEWIERRVIISTYLEAELYKKYTDVTKIGVEVSIGIWRRNNE